MIQTRRAKLSDIVYVANNIMLEDAGLYTKMTGDPFIADDVAAQLWLERPTRLWTFWETVGNFPVAIGGYAYKTPGVYGSFFLSTADAWKRGNQITERVAECVRSMFELPHVERLETVTLASRTQAREWYGRIGLRYHSTLCKASASGEDVVTYVVTRD